MAVIRLPKATARPNGRPQRCGLPPSSSEAVGRQRHRVSEDFARRMAHGPKTLESVSVGWKRLHRVRKPAGQEWRAARACRPPGKRRDAASGLPDATPEGRAAFGPPPRRSSVTMLWHGSLLSPCAGPKSAPCRCFHPTETDSRPPHRAALGCRGRCGPQADAPDHRRSRPRPQRLCQ